MIGSVHLIGVSLRRSPTSPCFPSLKPGTMNCSVEEEELTAQRDAAVSLFKSLQEKARQRLVVDRTSLDVALKVELWSYKMSETTCRGFEMETANHTTMHALPYSSHTYDVSPLPRTTYRHRCGFLLKILSPSTFLEAIIEKYLSPLLKPDGSPVVTST